MNNDSVYIYPNDFISLLKLFLILIEHNKRPYDIKDETYNPGLFDQVYNLKLPEENDQIEAFIKKMNKYIFSRMYYVFLSNHPKKELILYYFFLNYQKYGEKVLHYRNLKCVHELLKISGYVSHEAHRFTGFVRFQETKKGFLYAEINPENNILPLIAKHFEKRLKNEYWIIKDVTRSLIGVYDKKNFGLYSEDELKLFELEKTKNEIEMEELWKLFYQTIGIKERKNDRCRMNFMPKKYWKYMIEVSDEI